MDENIENMMKNEMLGSTMDDDDIRRKVNEMLDIKKALSMHNHKIYQSGDCWFTYVDDETCAKGRRLMKSRKEENLKKQLADYYIRHKISAATTFETVYKKWFSSCEETSLDKNTLHRYENYWNRYYKDKSWTKIPIENIQTSDLEEWGNYIIKNTPHRAKNRYGTYRQKEALPDVVGITRKEYVNMMIVLRKVIKYARKNNLLTHDPTLDMEVEKEFLPETKPSAEVATLMPDEYEKLYNLAFADFMETLDIAALAPLVAVNLGVRQAELLGLSWTDISEDKKFITVQRQWKKCSTLDHGEWCAEHKAVPWTKSGRKRARDTEKRTLYITNECRELFEMIKKVSDPESPYIFVRNDGYHLTGDSVKSKMIKYSMHIGKKLEGGIEIRSTHDLRRTTATRLKAAGLLDEQIRKILGHSNVRMTQDCYVFDQTSDATTEAQIEKALAKEKETLIQVVDKITPVIQMSTVQKAI